MQLTVVTLAALLTAGATGLGALPLLALRNGGQRFLGSANAIAAGAMLAASAGLAYEGYEGYAGGRLVWAGFVVGGLFMALTARMLAAHNGQAGLLVRTSADSLRMTTIVIVMTVHSISEGIGIGVAYGEGAALGVLITVALALHNVPEGLAISLVLVPRGISIKRAAGWSIFSSLPQPLLAVPAFLFVESFREALPVGLGFAAGAMVWMAAHELIPDARAEIGGRRMLAATLTAFAVMLALQAIFLT